jgi:tRNA-specific adenosine deaminase 1
MKSLPASLVSKARGTVLHDQHAEILAIRAFNRFLIDECAALLDTGKQQSSCVRRRYPEELTEVSRQPFTLIEGISIYMYCSEAPCGDSSMELVMQAQEDPTPWDTPPVSTAWNGQLHGRGYFSESGIVRRKPGTCDNLELSERN